MSAEENKSIYRRVYEEIVNKGNFALTDELIGEDYVYRAPGSPEFNGPEGFKQVVTVYRTAFPDLHIAIEDVMGEGDKVVGRFTARGTHRGELMGIPPTGNSITVTGIDLSRYRDGKMVDYYEIFDALGMMQQLGVIPAPGQAG